MKRRGPRFQVWAGPSTSQLSPVQVNADKTKPFCIKTDRFEGALTVRIKDFIDANGNRSPDTENNYFEKWSEMTCSIQIQGRFLHETSVDDCVWGNIFDKPIRDRLPYGTRAAVKAISLIDPSLETDVYSDKPWAWSPLIATMNHLQTKRLDSNDSPLPTWSGTRPIEDCNSLVGHMQKIASKPQRRKFFSSALNRRAIVLGPRDFINAEFANGFVDFSTLRLKLPVFNLTFDLKKIWDGQPVKYVCLSRKTSEAYFVVVIQILELNAENEG
ncbi:hypothetical protein O181_075432 [Austropuccinia psidii MF-1]|uniref:Domain of unknown function at the cortex 1 domain-containing protein n=1 Tax=Austropuccinia psidii MF-1 TaxID=1389203 RepID=A0A9Q3FCN7_9BASI|nr:hypothetical protein [Austropuccinia psidii MF-1]